jgi:phage baseplate assembly protein W
MDDVPHLALPFRLIGDRYATRQQDTDAEATDCVKALLSFMKGDRAEDPDFGIDDPTFQTQPIDTDDIARQIDIYEPRVNANITTVDQPDGTTTVKIAITVPTSDDLPEEE